MSAASAGCAAASMMLELQSLTRVLDAASALASAGDIDELLENAVTFARDSIGLGQVGLFVRDTTPRLVRMRGGWGASADGDAQEGMGLYHECSAAEHAELVRLRQHGQLWKYYAPDSREALAFQRKGVDPLWVIASPLCAGDRLLGVLYNVGGRSVPVDEGKQLQAAIFCSALTVLLLPNQQRLAWRASPPLTARRTVVERTLATIAETPDVRGGALARQFDLSPGHLGRLFKREVGVSLVEYRHRILLDRFFAAMARGNLKLVDAALEAGFGSYAQFHRVYCKLMGNTPRGLRGRRSATVSTAWASGH